MKNKKTMSMLLLGALLALASCAKSAGVGAVSGLSPTDGSHTTDTTPEFRWTAVDGAVKYQIQIAGSEADLAGSPPVDDKNVNGTSYTPTTALTNQQLHYWRVRAVDGEEQAGAWSGSSLRVEWGAVSGLSPTDGSRTTDTTPEFRWTAVDGAVKYQIQIAGSAADLEGSPPVDDKNVNGTSYTPTTALMNQQLHYWRVRAVDGEEQAGAWSGSSLRVDWGAVSGLSPTDGSHTTDNTPEFRWTAVDGAVKYQIQIAGSEADLAGSPPVDDKNVNGTSYTPTTALTNQQLHYWRVRAVDGEEQAGAWSGSSLRVDWGAVSGLSPTDGSRTTDTTPEFRWTAVDGAVKYQIQIADSEADLAGSPPVDDKNVNGTTYTPTTALTNQQLHYWRVRAVDGAEQAGAWSRSSLRVEWGAVSGLSPTDGSRTTDTTPEFRWTAVDGAVKYQIQIADSEADLAGSPPVDDKNVNGTSYTPTMALTNQQLHYWRVRAVDGEEQAGAWSGSSLRVDWGAVSGLSPTDGSHTTDTTPEFRWTAVDGAVKYQIQIAGSAADLEGSPPVDDKNVNGTTYTPTMALTNQQLHYWRVRAVDGEEQAGAWSRSSLRVEWGAVSGLSPTDGSHTTDITPEFRWTAVDGAVKYQIQIADSEADLAGSPPVDAEVSGSTSYTPMAALTNLQTHYWRIRAVDGAEQAGAWSGTQTLTVNFDIVSGLSPTDGSSTTDNTPEFTDMQAADEIENEDPGKRAELAELYKKRDLLQNQIDIVNKRIKAHKTWAWITIPLGILTTGAGVYFLASSEEAYKNYQDTSDTMAISEYKGQGALYEPLGYSLGGGGLALTVIGTISALTTPDHQKLKERYKSLINKITRMEEQLQ